MWTAAISLFLAVSAPNEGKELYRQYCASCHHPSGKGVPKVFPPLANSDWIQKDRERAIRAVIVGMQGKLRVNGQVYNGVMPASGLSDSQIARIMTFVFRDLGNGMREVRETEVAHLRPATSKDPNAPRELPPAPKGLRARIIAELPEKQRLAVVLRRYEQMPYEEIAKVLELSVSAVKSQLFREKAYIQPR